MKAFWYFTPAFTKTQLQHTNVTLQLCHSPYWGRAWGSSSPYGWSSGLSVSKGQPKPFSVELPVIVTIQLIRHGYCNYLTTIFYTTKMVTPVQTGLYSLSPLTPPCTFVCHHPPPLPPLWYFFLLLTRNIQRNM